MGGDGEGANVCLIACGRVSTRFYSQVQSRVVSLVHTVFGKIGAIKFNKWSFWE